MCPGSRLRVEDGTGYGDLALAWEPGWPEVSPGGGYGLRRPLSALASFANLRLNLLTPRLTDFPVRKVILSLHMWSLICLQEKGRASQRRELRKVL